jgi:hypothetical protein
LNQTRAALKENTLPFSQFFVAGYEFHDAEKCIKKLRKGLSLALVAEPENAHDACAVGIYYKTYKLGFVPRSKNQPISVLLNNSKKDRLTAKIVSIGFKELEVAVYLNLEAVP